MKINRPIYEDTILVCVDIIPTCKNTKLYLHIIVDLFQICTQRKVGGGRCRLTEEIARSGRTMEENPDHHRLLSDYCFSQTVKSRKNRLAKAIIAFAKRIFCLCNTNRNCVNKRFFQDCFRTPTPGAGGSNPFGRTKITSRCVRPRGYFYHCIYVLVRWSTFCW